MKPFSAACERNKEPILARLRPLFENRGEALEIGSGNGQHAVHFAAAMPHVTWTCSDLADRHADIRAWLEEARLPNLRGPLGLDVQGAAWPDTSFSHVFSANTAHIMAWPAVSAMFAGVGGVLRARGLFALYGPFNYDGEFTSESNRVFDSELRARDPAMGLRDMRDIEMLARSSGLVVAADFHMPANNRFVVFRKR